MTEHGGLGFNAANAPAKHAEAVDHCGVRICADARIWVSEKFAVNLAGHDCSSKIFDVDLVHDAGAWWNDFEVVERALTPAQELVSLGVALVFKFNVFGEGINASCNIDHNRVVDH